MTTENTTFEFEAITCLAAQDEWSDKAVKHYKNFVNTLPIGASPMVLIDLGSYKNAPEAKKALGDVYATHVTAISEKQEKERILKIRASLLNVSEAITKALVEGDMDKVQELTAEAGKLSKSLKKGARSGNGSRANNLPPYAEALYVLRSSKNAKAYAYRGTTESAWQYAILNDSDKYVYQGVLCNGKCHSWTTLNVVLSKKLGLGATNGLSGLSVPQNPIEVTE